jgi:hypothetical protein
MLALTMRQISNFSNMAIPDHTAKTRQGRIIYQNDPAVISTPNQLTLFSPQFFFTEYAISHEKNVIENGI